MSYKQMTGNIISATKVEPVGTTEVGEASGVWNLDDVYDYKRGANWPEAGVPGPDTLIENNFSTFLYTGNATERTITNNINLSDKGGLVWFKGRSDAYAHHLYDTERGVTKYLQSHDTNVEGTTSTGLTSFNTDGFTIGTEGVINPTNDEVVAWTFKQAPKFFDVVTYEGTGSARTVAHSLGGTVGMILIKNRDVADNWAVYHRGADASAPEDKYFILNTASTIADSAAWWNDTAPTTSVFTVGTDHAVNASGENYVAYIFAHETGADSMIQCGSYTGNGNNTGPVINLGWEPQWLLIHNTVDGDPWLIYDTMRGFAAAGNDIVLLANGNNPEDGADEANNWSNQGNYVVPTSTGFKLISSIGYLNGNNVSFIYMAIRRPNMATITDATEVFDIYNNSSDTTEPVFRTSPAFPVDYAWFRDAPGGADTIKQAARLTGPVYLNSTSTAAEASLATAKFDYMNGWRSTGGSGQYSWMWKRAKGYFDVVAYTGTGSAKTEAHSLSVAPEMIWLKNRSAAEYWAVYHKDLNGGTNPSHYFLKLNDTDAEADYNEIWNDTEPTDTQFTVGIQGVVNQDTKNYVAYLFATLAGISKVGSVTHSGSSTDVDCGFSAGARVVMLKRTDATGDWFWWDSTRGIIAGNDPYFVLNTNAAQVTNTDFIDPLASGFQISGDFTDGDYIFYAIA